MSLYPKSIITLRMCPSLALATLSNLVQLKGIFPCEGPCKNGGRKMLAIAFLPVRHLSSAK